MLSLHVIWTWHALMMCARDNKCVSKPKILYTKLEGRVWNSFLPIFDKLKSNQDNLYLLYGVAVYRIRMRRMPSANSNACINHNNVYQLANRKLISTSGNFSFALSPFLVHCVHLSIYALQLTTQSSTTPLLYTVTLSLSLFLAIPWHAMAFEINIVPYVVIIYWH